MRGQLISLKLPLQMLMYLQTLQVLILHSRAVQQHTETMSVTQGGFLAHLRDLVTLKSKIQNTNEEVKFIICFNVSAGSVMSAEM